MSISKLGEVKWEEITQSWSRLSESIKELGGPEPQDIAARKVMSISAELSNSLKEFREYF
jgi:hypothetical protein